MAVAQPAEKLEQEQLDVLGRQAAGVLLKVLGQVRVLKIIIIEEDESDGGDAVSPLSFDVERCWPPFVLPTRGE